MSSVLQTVDFSPHPNAKAPGLVPIRKQRATLSIAEEAAVREAEGIDGLDYVFFRRFSDGRSSQVAAYVIDNEDEHFDDVKLSLIHKEVWLNGSAPLLYVGRKTRVDILGCAGGPDFWRKNRCDYHPIEKIQVDEDGVKDLFSTSAAISKAIEEKRQRFSALRLSNGTFWTDPRNASLADADKGSHQRLINAVVETDEAIDGGKHPVLRRLLLLTVLIKYLEDRDVFPAGWFGEIHRGANCFFDVLQKGTPDEVRELLGKLERKFNGDVFCLPEDCAAKLTAKELRKFAELVESRTLKKQLYLWEQYSFRHLPVEVLSHLYQRFAQSGKGAIFTPPFVATLLLDYALPYDSISGNERILDPTCGSGVFLVGAFRRLVVHWRSENQWRQPDVPTLKAILKQSIFGVEIQGEALHLAAFSLALAVCDALKPNVIWRELRFDNLSKTNLTEGDFFDFVEKKREPFDVIVGNPPFISSLTESAARVNDKAELIRGGLPDNQIAYLVAEQAMRTLGEGGCMCLIQPSSLLYNEKARAFQKHLFTTNQIDCIFDFTSVRGLFDKADTKIAALLVRKITPAANHRIIHQTFRRTFSVQEQIGFELDHYDHHVVSQQQALTAPYSWKANLLGGGRLQHLAARLKTMGTLEDFLADKKWNAGEGFIAGETGKRVEASWLTGKPLLNSEALSGGGITTLVRVEDELFTAPRKKDRYKSPLILIREHQKLHCAFWENGFLAYKDKIVGIRAPLSERDVFYKFFREFKNHRSTLQAFSLLESTQLLIGRATALLKRDIVNLPWPKVGESWDLSSWEKILCEDLVNYMADYIRLGQDSRLLKEQASDEDLKLYGGCFCDLLGTIYDNLKFGSSWVLDGLACQTFYFGKKPDLDWTDDWTENLRDLIYIQNGDALRTARVLRIYQNNVMFIVKPDRLRYWIRSTAIRDADETLIDLRKQGY
jgi:hypothetical protein